MPQFLVTFWRQLLAAVLLAIAAGSTQARPAESELRPLEIKFGHTSSVQFHVSIFGMFKKRGSFTQMRGALIVEKGAARVTVHIQTASAVMKSPSDAALLKSPAYFDAANFPEIVFQSNNFPLSILSNGGQISGKLTVKGVSQQQVFKLTTKPCQPAFAQTPWRCGFDVAGTLKRSEFGMKARRGVVSDEVVLMLSITAPAKNPD